MSDDRDLPPYETIVELIGPDRAAQLSQALGGRRIYVPREPGMHHPLTVAIGDSAARIVAAAFPSCRLDIPMTPGKRLKIVSLRREYGWTVPRIAAELRCTERHVYQVLADERSSEPGLFD